MELTRELTLFILIESSNMDTFAPFKIKTVSLSRIKIHDKIFEPFISAEEIDKAVTIVAENITKKYRGKKPVFIGVLNGCFFFAADLMKKINFSCEISFVKVASYVGTQTSGDVRQLLGLDQKVSGRDVIIIEDIVDTGNTIEAVTEIISNMGASSVAVATLLMKPDVYNKKIKIDHVAIEIDPSFVVGYGLDYDGFGRNLNQLYVLSQAENLKSNEDMLNIVLFGPPGAGKGTQAIKLKEKYDLVHLSTGDILRNEINNETELGTLAKSFMNKGELVPDEVVIDMIGNCLNEYSDAKGFIFDGFPRTTEQAQALDNLLEEHSTEIDTMLSLEVDDEELVDRIIKRGQESGREDDKNESVIFNRIITYIKKTAPLKSYYDDQGKYHAITGIGSVDDVFERLTKSIKS
ncbi:adenylate kinase [Vicingaceae bacterium]|nr:adenylate kinase [Vicingaceae bacterium]MDB4082950.1 adenylate kinase [Vicingaceae bacterium]MDB9963558.1 adenylate kinase [Vicingaceae bacterium]